MSPHGNGVVALPRNVPVEELSSYQEVSVTLSDTLSATPALIRISEIDFSSVFSLENSSFAVFDPYTEISEQLPLMQCLWNIPVGLSIIVSDSKTAAPTNGLTRVTELTLEANDQNFDLAWNVADPAGVPTKKLHDDVLESSRDTNHIFCCKNVNPQHPFRFRFDIRKVGQILRSVVPFFISLPRNVGRLECDGSRFFHFRNPAEHLRNHSAGIQVTTTPFGRFGWRIHQ